MNENDIVKIYKEHNFEKKSMMISSILDLKLDLFSSFLTSGAPETPYKNLSLKKLIDAMLDSDFKELSDEEQCAYFQEFHNRIAKHYRFPAVNVYVLPQQPEDAKRLGSVEKRTPLHYVLDTKGEQFDNTQLNIDNKMSRGSKVIGVSFSPSTIGLENIMTLLHESRHVAQFYAQSVFMQNNQILAENELNAVAYLQLLGAVVNNLAEGRSLDPDAKTDSLYPEIKNKYLTKESLEILKTYKLAPEEIDARMFAYQQMNLLAERGYLDNTNWEKYKGIYLIDEYKSLNQVRFYAQDVCPSIRFLKERKKILEKNFDILCNLLEDNGRPKELVKIEKAIDFNKYYKTIQDFYNELKTELRYIMLDDAKKMKEMADLYQDEDVSINYINKLKNGAEQICDENLMMQLSVADNYSDNHSPFKNSSVEQINKSAYCAKKEIKRKKEEEKILKELQDNKKEEQLLDPSYEFERE